MKFFITSLLFALLLIVIVTDGRKDPGEYWGENAIEVLADLTLNEEGKSLVKDFEPRPNQLLVWRGHKEDAATSTSFVKDFEPRPNQLFVWRNHKEDAATGTSFVKDFEPRPNQLLVWRNHKQDAATGTSFVEGQV